MKGKHINVDICEEVFQMLDSGKTVYQICIEKGYSHNTIFRIKVIYDCVKLMDAERLKTYAIKYDIGSYAEHYIRIIEEKQSSQKQKEKCENDKEKQTKEEVGAEERIERIIEKTEVIGGTLDDLLQTTMRLEKVMENINNTINMMVYQMRR